MSALNNQPHSNKTKFKIWHSQAEIRTKSSIRHPCHIADQKTRLQSIPEMHFIMKTRRFAHFIMKTPAGKRPIPPKPMSTKGLTKPAHQQQLFHRARAPVVQKILGFSRRFLGFSRRILGKFSGCFCLCFSHTKNRR